MKALKQVYTAVLAALPFEIYYQTNPMGPYSMVESLESPIKIHRANHSDPEAIRKNFTQKKNFTLQKVASSMFLSPHRNWTPNHGVSSGYATQATYLKMGIV